MEIPQNNVKDELTESVIKKVMKDLEADGTYFSYRRSSGIPYDVAAKVCGMFVDKGYHAHISHFCDGRATYQAMVISKNRLSDKCGGMIYYEDFG